LNDDYLDIPEVRSSKELLKRLSVKREKGIEATKNPMVVPNGQFKLTNFEVGCQLLLVWKILNNIVKI